MEKLSCQPSVIRDVPTKQGAFIIDGIQQKETTGMHRANTFDSIAMPGIPMSGRWLSPGKGNVENMQDELTDGDLIKRYLQANDEEALQTLVRRYYDSTRRRFLSHCRHAGDADDLTQQLWVRVIDSLENYRDDGRFHAFLNRISTNLLTDYWRRKGIRNKVIEQRLEQSEPDPISLAPASDGDSQTRCEMQQEIDYLIKELIPALPWEQRLAFLLRHESEYWEGKQRLGWNHIAELNGIDESGAWHRFEQARNKLLLRAHGGHRCGEEELDGESLLIFLVWTQAQRPSKLQEFTWDYFAGLLNVSTNTLKTRYRAALKKLGEGLRERE